MSVSQSLEQDNNRPGAQLKTFPILGRSLENFKLNSHNTGRGGDEERALLWDERRGFPTGLFCTVIQYKWTETASLHYKQPFKTVNVG